MKYCGCLLFLFALAADPVAADREDPCPQATILCAVLADGSPLCCNYWDQCVVEGNTASCKPKCEEDEIECGADCCAAGQRCDESELCEPPCGADQTTCPASPGSTATTCCAPGTQCNPAGGCSCGAGQKACAGTSGDAETACCPADHFCGISSDGDGICVPPGTCNPPCGGNKPCCSGSSCLPAVDCPPCPGDDSCKIYECTTCAYTCLSKGGQSCPCNNGQTGTCRGSFCECPSPSPQPSSSRYSEQRR